MAGFSALTLGHIVFLCIFTKNALLRVLCKCFMDLEFFNRILSVDSTSGKEGALADMLSAESYS